jgi:hypothetical protein
MVKSLVVILPGSPTLAPQDEVGIRSLDSQDDDAGVCEHRMELSKAGKIIFPRNREKTLMARKYSKKASAKVERAMKKRNAGTLKSGRSGRKVRSRKQAIAIGLSEARREGAKVPKKSAKKTAKKRKAA